MKHVTMKQIQNMASKYDCQFYKGKGYFYFTSLKYIFDEQGVCVYYLNDLTLEQWESELQRKIKDATEFLA